MVNAVEPASEDREDERREGEANHAYQYGEIVTAPHDAREVGGIGRDHDPHGSAREFAQ
jgi:hypothetical protein